MNNGILVATQSGEVNLNIDQKTLDMCIKTSSSWGETKYTNICNGESYTIPIGSLDFTGAIILVAIGVAFVGMFLKMIVEF